jgi:hypothetical protein
MSDVEAELRYPFATELLTPVGGTFPEMCFAVSRDGIPLPLYQRVQFEITNASPANVHLRGENWFLVLETGQVIIPQGSILAGGQPGQATLSVVGRGSWTLRVAQAGINRNPQFFEKDDGHAVEDDQYYRVDDHFPQRMPRYWTRLPLTPENYNPIIEILSWRWEGLAVPEETLPDGPCNIMDIHNARVSQDIEIANPGFYQFSFYYGCFSGRGGRLHVGLANQNSPDTPVFSETFDAEDPSTRRFVLLQPLIREALPRGTYTLEVFPPVRDASIALFQLIPQVGAATAVSLSPVKGDEQAAFLGATDFPEYLQAHATRDGLDAGNVDVTFSFVNNNTGTTFEGEPSATSTRRTTGDTGLTPPVHLTPGPRTGIFQVQASADGADPITFHLALAPARNTFRFSSDPEHIEIERGSSRQVRVLLQSNGVSWPYIGIQGSLLQDNPPPVFFFDRYNGPTVSRRCGPMPATIMR